MKSYGIRWVATIALGILCVLETAQAQWVQSTKFGDTGYFLMASTPPRIERYTLTNSQWAAPIGLPSIYGAPTAFCVDGQGIYVAFGQTIRGFGLDGKNETPLISTADQVNGLFTDGPILLANRSTGLYGRFTSLNKTNGNVIAQFENYVDAVSGASIARSIHKIFGRSVGVSPSDITFVNYNPDGTFGTGGDSPYHGAYPSATKTWVFPDDAKVVDSSGTVYSTDSLTYLNSLGGTVDDIDFYGGSIPIVLRGTSLLAFSNALLPTGSKTLSYTPQSIFVTGTNVLTFTADSTRTNGIRDNAIPVSSLNPPTPGQAVDPNGLAYTPDDSFLDKNGILYLLSKSQQSIFRWDTATQQYLSTIPLIAVPSFFAYSATNHAIYLAYNSGLIRKIDLGSTTFQEVPFTSVATAPRGLSTAGQYIFATDSSGAWGTHYTFSPSGTKIASKDWNYYSTEYIWSEANQKMYFFRDDTSPNDILWEQINANGTAYDGIPAGGIGTEIDSPLHDSAGFVHPIRVAPSGSIAVLGSGVIHDATTLARLSTSLGNSVTDIAWCNGTIKTIRTISGVMQCQDWSLVNYGLKTIQQFPGTAHRLLALGSNKLVAIAILGGVPSFYVLDGNFDVIAPPVITAPTGLKTAIISLNQVNLSWLDVSGDEGYVIERKSGSNGIWSQIGTASASATNCIDPSVTTGNVYYYRVSATNGLKRSVASAESMVSMVAPDAPSDFALGAVSSNSIQLQWTDVANETGYLLERKIGTGSWSQIAVLSAGTSSYLISLLTPDTDYSFRIRATNAIGVSSYSSVASATTDAVVPSAPTLFSVTALDAYQVYVSWFNVVYEKNYVVERQTSPTGPWSTVGTTATDVTSFRDTNVAPLTTYYYRVYATNRAGASSYSSVMGVTTPQIPPPSTPSGLLAKAATASSISVSWNPALGATSYRLEHRTEDPNSWALVSLLSSNQTSCIDTNLAHGVRYYYRVKAFNQFGNSDYSAEVSAIPDTIVRLIEDDFDPGLNPGVWASIEGGIVTNGTGFATGNALWFGAEGARSAATVPLNLCTGGTLNFSIRAGNELVDGNDFWNNSEAGENVVVEYSSDSGPWTSLQTLNTVFPGASNWVNISIEIPQGAQSPNTQIRFRQLSHSGLGYDCWALDNVSIDGAAPAAPSAPPFVITSPSSATSISIWWAEANGATWYALERKQGTNAWTELARVPSGQTYFTDTLATPSSAYSYRVKSVNAGGESGYSMLATAVTWSQQEQWSYDNFGSIDAVTIGEMGSTNTDGIPLLVRYAFNLSAKEPAHALVPGVSTNGTPAIWVDSKRGKVCIEFVQRNINSNPGITYQIQAAEKLGTWTPVNTGVSATPIDSIWGRSNYEESLDPQAPAKFFRVIVRIR